MKKGFFRLGIWVITFIFGMLVFSCSNSTTDPTGYHFDNDGSLDGTWNGSINKCSITISGDDFSNKYDGTNVDKGKISYNGSSFTTYSTHTWNGGGWEPWSEEVNANYILSGTTMTVSGLSGQYSVMNGVYTK